jgi:anti-sigma factor RsiW
MIDEQTLMFYFYDDGLTLKERRAVEAALRSDPDLAERYARLRNELDQLTAHDAPPAPTHLVQQLHDSIERAARSERIVSTPVQKQVHAWSFIWGAAITAALAIGIGIGVYFSGSGNPESSTNNVYANNPGVATSVVPASFTRGLESHLQQSRWDISRLSADTPADRAVLVQQIIEQNRMFESIAKQKSAPNLARVLRAFEPILIRLASEDIAPDDAEALRAQLSFELNVMLTKLARDTSKEVTTT